MDEPWHVVHTIDDWYDGSRGGVADYFGVSHYYRSIYLDTPTWNPDEDRFELTLLPTVAFEAALELQAIWEKWHQAYKAGTAPEDPDDERVLPEDKTKNAELTQILAAGRESGKDRIILVRGEFKLGCKHVCWRKMEQEVLE
ncbi:hypothetical protein [Zavarzinella formosa]|uniref:hypothetical protein n=1 Tax=Zavarzinella formosa TaxID=360055 RepID=UPI0012F896B6|nr:hypothetical protein [Zavarzinella formosa]